MRCKHMSIRIWAIALLTGLSLAGWVAPAQAQQWKYGRPGGSWVAIWEGNVTSVQEGWYQAQCKYAHPTKESNALYPDDGGRYLAVYVYNFVAIYVECFYHSVPETVVHTPDISARGAPDEPADFFNPADRTNFPSQVVNPNGPFVPAVGVHKGALDMRLHPNLCIDIAASRLDDGAAVQTYGCHNGPNQQVLLSFGQRGQIVAMPGATNAQGYSMCLDFYPGQGKDGDPVHIYPCHQLRTGVRDTQLWWPVEQQLRSSTGYCLTSNGGSAPGYLVLQSCQMGRGQPTPYDWEPYKTSANNAGEAR